MIHTDDIKQEASRWAEQHVDTQRCGIRVLEQLEHATLSLLGRQPHSVEVYTPAGDAVYVNEAWRKLWGMHPIIMEEYNMLKDENLRTKATWPAIERGFNGTAGPTPEAPFTPEEIGFPGRHRWTDGYIAPVWDSGHNTARVVLMLRDVTDVKLAMSEIARLRNDLQSLQHQYEAITNRLDNLASGNSIRLDGMPAPSELRIRARSLSIREREVFALLAADKSVKEIAFQLNLGTKSVYTYRARMMEKLGLTSDVQVAAAYTIIGEINNGNTFLKVADTLL